MLGRFSCYWGPHAFCYRDKRGGCNKKSAGGVTSPLSLNSFVFLSLSPYSRLPDCRYRKIREDDSDPPPKRGGHAAPIAALCNIAPIPAPGGRYRRYLSLREGSEKTPRSGVN